MIVDGRQKINKADLSQYPLFRYEGEIVLVETLADQKQAAVELQKETVLGFDTETRPNFRKGQKNDLALLQLATSKKVFLFRLNLMSLTSELVAILSNPLILKLGVAVRDDVLALQNLKSFEAGGFIDLAKLAKQKGLCNFGLSTLTVVFFGNRLGKGPKLSNWEINTFKDSQKHYAAADAYVALNIYKGLSQLEDVVLEKKKKQQETTSPEEKDL